MDSRNGTVCPSSLVTATEFRMDINGLRAWAVLIVVLYHFGVPGFAGGFVGVDVFFVISGFLMTGIVVRGLQAGRFSLVGFYMARARRIVPALWVLCASLLLLGWFVLLPPDYKMLGTHAVTAMTFWSNIRFTQEAGYFDAASHDKWLLHTWSLSLEWQFYLLLPLVLMLLWRWRPSIGWMRGAVLAALMTSFMLSVWVTDADAAQAFYGLHTRAWEMLAGGALYLLGTRNSQGTAKPWLAPAAEWLGFALIGSAVVWFDARTAWPGWRALVPVVGAVLVIWARRPASLLTGSRAAQWLGDKSYSLYLWHWPVVVALTYLGLQSEPAFVVLGLLACVLLAIASYRWVESWGRKGPRTVGVQRWRPLAVYAVGVGLLCVPAAAVWKLDGVPGRSDPIAEKAAAEAKNTNPTGDKCITSSGPEIQPCRHGGPEVKLILLGDSHSNAVATAVEAALSSPEAGFEQWSYSACPMVIGARPTPGTATYGRKNYQCTSAVEAAISRLSTENVGIPLLLVTRPSLPLLGLNETGRPEPPEFFIGEPVSVATPNSVRLLQEAYVKTVCELTKRRPVYLLRPIPEIGFNVPQRAGRQLAAGVRSEISLPLQDYMQRNAHAWQMQDMAQKACGAHIVDATPVLCPGGACMATRDYLPLYADDDHLNETGNRALVVLFQQLVR